MANANGRGKSQMSRQVELDAMDELAASLRELQQLQNSLQHLDIDPESEEFDWDKLS